MASRRQWLKAALAALGGIGAGRRGRALAAPPELGLPADTPTQAYDFGAAGIAGWMVVSGQWTVEEPADSPSGLGQWHTVRLVAVGGYMQAWLDRARLLDHHDSRLRMGQIGLWTKADSVTAFDELTVRGRKED